MAPPKASTRSKMPAPRMKSNFFVDPQGDESSGFDLKLSADAIAAFDKRWVKDLIYDDYAFQASLRWFAAQYFFLGGVLFQRRLATIIGVTESTVNRWVNAQSAPSPGDRVEALNGARSLLDRVVAMRQAGALLADMVHQG